MKILFYGAGVLGSLYAARLHEAGHDVSILARGRRLEELEEHGVVLQDANTGRQTTARVRVVEQIAAEDAYDLVVVIVRKNQLSSVLQALAESEATSDVLFMHNNASGPSQMVDALGRERVLLGFPGAGGTREGHVVHYLDPPGWLQRMQPAVFGELDGGTSPRLERIMGAFREAGLYAAAVPNMDAWLKTHASVVVAGATALYAAGGDVHRLSRTGEALILAVRATRENFGVLRALGAPVTPKSPLLLALGWLPEPLLVPLLRRLFDTETAETAIVPHANATPDEIGQLAGELVELSRTAAVPTPAADWLRKYLDSAVPPIPEGRARTPMELRAAGVAAFGAAVGALIVLRLLRSR